MPSTESVRDKDLAEFGDALTITANADLSSLNTLAVPSCAEFFAKCASIEALRACIRWANQRGLPVKILAGGSNALLDAHISGLVIQPCLQGKFIDSVTGDGRDIDASSISVRCRAGENWHDFVQWTIANQAYGLENLSLIPGSVGAAPIQNIGAYGVEVAQCIDEVVALDVQTLALRTFSAMECQFAYRHSYFKTPAGRAYIICEVRFTLARGFIAQLGYPVLAKQLQQTLQPNATDQSFDPQALSASQVADAVIAIRSARLPLPEQLPNAGSFFKNPIVAREQLHLLQQQFHKLPSFDVDAERVKLAAAWLIDHAGWKQRDDFLARVHNTQALVIVNPKRAPLNAVLALAQAIQADVAEKFGVHLDIEPQQLAPLSAVDGE